MSRLSLGFASAILVLTGCGTRTALPVGVGSLDGGGMADLADRLDRSEGNPPPDLPEENPPPDVPPDNPCRSNDECDDGDDCTVDICTNGGCARAIRDRDGDGFEDGECGGTDCNDRRPGVFPGARERCLNGRDDDCDELVDCEDEACAPRPECSPSCPNETIGSALGNPVATGTTDGAGNDSAGNCQGGDAPEIAYRWVAPEGRRFEINTFGSSYDTVLYVRTSCEGMELACNDDSLGLDSQVFVTVRAGTELIIFVDGWSTSVGDFVLNIN